MVFVVFHEQIGAVFVGAAQAAGQFFSGLLVPTIKDSVAEVTPIIREEVTQALKDNLPTIREETVHFISESSAAATAATKEAAVSLLPIAFVAAIGAVVLVKVAR